ncbi:MAG: low molecular weight phosphotyrosine protein phosphatase [Chloroflexi bacterium]|nr:low molecular weight phosphotyrosine protein phosphatase [Chloroflexota bacterium]
MENSTIRVVFVCLGNICRSPMAEAVFKSLVKKAGLEEQFIISSGGTGGWHAGERPHAGTQTVLKLNQVYLDPQKRAQKVNIASLREADYVVVMDRENAAELKRLGVESKLLLSYCDNGHPLDVPDPYYEQNFDVVYDLVRDGCQCMLNEIRAKHGL